MSGPQSLKVNSGMVCVGQVWYCLATCVCASRAETSNIDEVLKQGPIFVKQETQHVSSS